MRNPGKMDAEASEQMAKANAAATDWYIICPKTGKVIYGTVAELSKGGHCDVS